MVSALVQLDENTNRVLDTVKAKYRLKDKGQAIQLVVSKFIEESGDYELRPEFIRLMQKKIKDPKFINMKSIGEYYLNKKS